MNKKLIAWVAATLAHVHVTATTFYVDASKPDNSGDGLSWTTAKKTIQAAVDQAVADDTVLVTNGVYNSGARANAGFALLNRLVITNAITVRSVSGPAQTVIEGSGKAAYNSTGAVRCVYMTGGVLDGFTLRGGATRTFTSYDKLEDCGGGAVCMLGAGQDVRNCVIRDSTAYNGGGVLTSTDGIIHGRFSNCLLTGNSAMYGGGSYWASLFNCTVTSNTAFTGGGGVYAGTLKNSIVFGNARGTTANNCASISDIEYSCTTPLPTGTGNISSDPQFISVSNGNFRLKQTSPCRNAGSNAAVSTPADLDGNSRISEVIVDMGAYEFLSPKAATPVATPEHGTVATNTLVVALSCTTPLATIFFKVDDGSDPIPAPTVYSSPISLTNSARIIAFATTSNMQTSDVLIVSYTIRQQVHKPFFNPPSGTSSAEPLSVLIACSDNDAKIRYTLDGSDPTESDSLYSRPIDINGPAIVKARAFRAGMFSSEVATARYNVQGFFVDAGRPDDSGDGLTWATAKKTIQAAVDLAQEGDTILVTNGVYNMGSRITPGMFSKNRLVITNSVTVRSVNGPNATVIQGAGKGAYATPEAIRCVYMTRGVLDGFTLRDGATLSFKSYSQLDDCGGGAVCMLGDGEEVRNCVIRDNAAYNGGGVMTSTDRLIHGRFYNCLIINNTAVYGGGAYWAALFNCTITGNTASMFIGGTYSGSMMNSISYGNTCSGASQNYHDMAAVDYSCSSPLPAGTGNLATAPGFLNSTNGNFRLSSSSPCLNSGNNSAVSGACDLAGNPRVLCETVDMGAFEGYPVIVTFEPDNGTGSASTRDVLVGGVFGALPIPEKAGHTFAGWWTEPGGEGAEVRSETTVTNEADFALFAAWTPNLYTVTFDTCGGEASPASRQVTFGTAYGTLPLPVWPEASRPQYAFVGWFTEPSGSGLRIAEDTPVSRASDHTLYAKWTAEPYVCDPGTDGPLSAPGTYTGHLYAPRNFGGQDVQAIRGSFTLSLTHLYGKLTAKAAVQQGTLTFSGRAWDASTSESDTRQVTLVRPGGETLVLFVRQNRIWGSLSGGTLGAESLTLDGTRNRFKDSADETAQAALETYRGYYTVALPLAAAAPTGAAAAAPEGSGFLTVTVGAAGAVKIGGRLADGTSLSLSTTLTLFDGCGPYACAPVFSPLYARKGWLGALLWFTPGGRATLQTDRELGWQVCWQKPADKADGADCLLEAVGGYYSPVSAVAEHYRLTAETNAVTYHHAGGDAALQTEALPTLLEITFNGTKLAAPAGNRPPRVGDAYDYSGANSAQTTFSLISKTGLFSGEFNLYYDYLLNGRLTHKSVRVPYSGVVTPVRGDAFADEPAGQGYYLVPDSSPAWQGSRLKRSFLITLEGATEEE